MSTTSSILPTLRRKKTRKDELPRRISTFDGGPLQVSAKEKNKVQDRIKNRLSTKIGAPMLQGTSRPPLPKSALQNINNANRIQIPREPPSGSVQARSQAARPLYDPAVFNEPDFDPESYVKRMLATATPAELDAFFQALQESKNATNSAMQKNVFHNYREFIMISKEIGVLETDMGSIRSLLGELRGITESLKDDSVEDESSSIRSAGRRGARNSIVDFHQLNKNHLKALWAQVEGAQKYLPADDGRRIVRESGAWTELNAATWRPKHRVHIVLLNDHLLLAQKRPKPSGSGQRLIADRCFPLVDIKMREFKDEEMQTAISVRSGSGREKFVFKADSLEEKKAMVVAFSREAAESQAAQRQLGENESTQGASLDTSRNSQIIRLSRRLSKNPGLQRNGSISLPTTDGEVVDLVYVQERMDDLDQRIAHREFKEAVRSILRGRALVTAASIEDLAAELTSLRLDERRDRLSDILAAELEDECSKSRTVKDLVTFMVAIGTADKARSTFLRARSRLIEKRSRGVLFEGDLSLYISDLALVQFTLIKNTATSYTNAFAAPEDMSGLVAWAKMQVEAFADIFNRQLYGIPSTTTTFQESLESVSKQIAVLRDVGLDLAFVVENALTRRSKQEGQVNL